MGSDYLELSHWDDSNECPELVMENGQKKNSIIIKCCSSDNNAV